MISSDSIHSSQGEALTALLKFNRERMDSVFNRNKETEELSEDKSSVSSKESKKAENPFERLVKTITKTDLSLQGKKSQIHYVKYALYGMDDEQARAFEMNVKTLLYLREQNQNRRSHSNSLLTTLENELHEIEEKIKKSQDRLKNLLEEKTNEESKNVDSIQERINNLLKPVEEKQFEPFNSLKVSYQDQSINQYVVKLNEEFVRITSPEESGSKVDLVS
ncbi:MAG: hypothetical protein KAI43_04340 [Candidatus Aureabacteria bacterium]|nr:hypothetical protein [Candidatus Auribacterota bacterium]